MVETLRKACVWWECTHICEHNPVVSGICIVESRDRIGTCYQGSTKNENRKKKSDITLWGLQFSLTSPSVTSLELPCTSVYELGPASGNPAKSNCAPHPPALCNAPAVPYALQHSVCHCHCIILLLHVSVWQTLQWCVQCSCAIGFPVPGTAEPSLYTPLEILGNRICYQGHPRSHPNHFWSQDKNILENLAFYPNFFSSTLLGIKSSESLGFLFCSSNFPRGKQNTSKTIPPSAVGNWSL